MQRFFVSLQTNKFDDVSSRKCAIFSLMFLFISPLFLKYNFIYILTDPQTPYLPETYQINLTIIGIHISIATTST